MKKAVGQITITDLNDPIISGSPPENPKPGQLWLNTSVTPNELLSWENGTWKTVRSQPKPGSVGQAELQQGAVTSSKIANNAITSTKITGGAITTPKLATNAVTATKIAAGAITAEKIQAGAITADKLDVLAKSLVNNYSVTGKTEGWSPTPLLSTAGEFGNTKFHLMRNTANVQVLSDPFEVDPTGTYRVNISVRVPSSAGTRFFGLYCYDANNLLVGVTPVYVSSKTSGTATKNPYFWSQSGVVNNWLNLEGYILGCNTSNYSIPETKNVTTCFRLPRNAHHVRLRYLNYPNGTEADAYWWGPSVVSVDAGEIQAERITTGRIKSKNNESWLDLLNGRFSFGNGAISWNGGVLNIQGQLKSTMNGKSAHISNGQYFIESNGKEVLNISNFIGSYSSDAYIVLGNAGRKLHISKSKVSGMVDYEFMTFDASTSDGLIRLYKNLEVVNGIKFGKIQYWDFGDGGIGLTVNGNGIVLNAGRYGLRIIKQGIVYDFIP